MSTLQLLYAVLRLNKCLSKQAHSKTFVYTTHTHTGLESTVSRCILLLHFPAAI